MVCCRGSRRGGLERGGDHSAGSRAASDGPYRGARPWAVYELGLPGDPEIVSGIVGELEPLSTPSFPSDRGKAVGLGLLRL